MFRALWPFSPSVFYRLEIPCAGCQTPQQNSMQSVHDLQTGLCKTKPQMLGELPEDRVTQHPAFSTIGVDYAGPFLLKKGHTRKPVIIKSYLAVFVCFSTKAIHLEVVSDLTTEAFLACLRRFISRRGCPSTIQSDNGSNFKGTKNDLQELYRFLKKTATDSSVAHYLSSQLIQWTMIPEKSPHFGGLWEAAVKSAKFHLKRIVGPPSKSSPPSPARLRPASTPDLSWQSPAMTLTACPPSLLATSL